MITMSKGKSAADAVDYYDNSEKDYYTFASSQWYGKGAEALGLTGQIKREDFKALAAGLDPRDPRKTLVEGHATKEGEERRAGNDMTYHAPKSMSVAYAAAVVVGDYKIADKLANIFLDSVQEHLGYAEQEFSACRIDKNIVKTGNMAAGVFLDLTNRNGDPQLHAHVFVTNATMDPQQKWRANEPSPMYKAQKSNGLTFRGTLDRNLNKGGFGTVITDRNQYYFDLKGIQKSQMDYNSTRRTEILREFEKNEAAGKFKGLRRAEKLQMAQKVTAQRKEHITHSDLKHGWADRYEDQGISAEDTLTAFLAEMTLEKEGEQQELQAKEGPDAYSAAIFGIEQESGSAYDLSRLDGAEAKEKSAWAHLDDLREEYKADRVEAERSGEAEWRRNQEGDGSRGHGAIIPPDFSDIGDSYQDPTDKEMFVSPQDQGLSWGQEGQRQPQPEGRVNAAEIEAPAVATADRFADRDQPGADVDPKAYEAVRAAIVFAEAKNEILDRGKIGNTAAAISRGEISREALDKAFDSMISSSPAEIAAGKGLVRLLEKDPSASAAIVPHLSDTKFTTAAALQADKNLVKQMEAVPGRAVSQATTERILDLSSGLSDSEKQTVRDIAQSTSGVIVTQKGHGAETAKTDTELGRVYSAEGLGAFRVGNINRYTDPGTSNGFRNLNIHDVMQPGYDKLDLTDIKATVKAFDNSHEGEEWGRKNLEKRYHGGAFVVEGADKMSREQLSATVTKLQDLGAVKIELRGEAGASFGASQPFQDLQKHANIDKVRIDGGLEHKGKSDQVSNIINAVNSGDKKQLQEAVRGATIGAGPDKGASLATAVAEHGKMAAEGKAATIICADNADRLAANQQIHDREVSEGRQCGTRGEITTSVSVTPRGDDRFAAENYSKGWEVVRGGKSLGNITSVDLVKNTLQVASLDAKGNPVVKTLDVAKDGPQLQCRSTQKSEFSTGERVEIGKGLKVIQAVYDAGGAKPWQGLNVVLARQTAQSTARRNWVEQMELERTKPFTMTRGNQVKIKMAGQTLRLDDAKRPEETAVDYAARMAADKKLVSVLVPTKLQLLNVLEMRLKANDGIKVTYRQGVTARTYQPKKTFKHDIGWEPAERKVIDNVSLFGAGYVPKAGAEVIELNRGEGKIQSWAKEFPVMEVKGKYYILADTTANNPLEHGYVKSPQLADRAQHVGHAIIVDSGQKFNGSENSQSLGKIATAATDGISIVSGNAKQTADKFSEPPKNDRPLDFDPAQVPELQKSEKVAEKAQPEKVVTPATAGPHQGDPFDSVATGNEVYQSYGENPFDLSPSAEKAGKTAPSSTDLKDAPPEAEKFQQEKAEVIQQTAHEAIREAISVREETQSVFTKAQLMETATRYSDKQHGAKELSAAFDQMQQLGDITHLNTHRGTETFSTPEMIKLEQANIDRLNTLEGKFQSQTNAAEVDKFIDAYQERRGITYNKAQREAIQAELVDSHGALAVQGDPGTGKTAFASCVEAFNKEVLEPSGRGHFTISSAYTGKAAEGLAEATGKEARTINTLLAMKTEAHKCPPGAAICLKVDEASFVGSKQAAQLLNLRDELERSGYSVKILFQGDTKQKGSISAGTVFKNILEKTNATKVFLKEIIRQNCKDLLSVTTQMSIDTKDPKVRKEHVTAALGKLDQMGCIKEVEGGRTGIMKTTVAEFFALKGSTKEYIDARTGEKMTAVLDQVGITVLRNSERKELNTNIRAQLKVEGKLTDEREVKTLVPASGLSAEKLGLATNYKVGQTVQFVGSTNENGQPVQYRNEKMGTSYDVVSQDSNANTVTLERQNPRSGEMIVKTFPADEIRDKVAVYDKVDKPFAVGDQFVCLKNDKELGVSNGTAGICTGWDKQGGMVSEIDGKTKNLGNYKSLDHGYAVTSEKSQGVTWDAEISPRDTGNTKTSYETEEVGKSRPRFHTVTITDSKEKYIEQACKSAEKTDTVKLHGAEKLTAHQRKQSALENVADKGMQALAVLKGEGADFNKSQTGQSMVAREQGKGGGESSMHKIVDAFAESEIRSGGLAKIDQFAKGERASITGNDMTHGADDKSKSMEREMSL